MEARVNCDCFAFNYNDAAAARERIFTHAQVEFVFGVLGFTFKCVQRRIHLHTSAMRASQES